MDGSQHAEVNVDKTEFIIFGTHQQLAKVSDLNIKIGCESIPPTEHIRSLGYQMDSYLMNTQNMNKLVSTLFGTLHDINTIRSRIDQGTTKIVIQDLVLSKLDCCNSLLGHQSVSLKTTMHSKHGMQNDL